MKKAFTISASLIALSVATYAFAQAESAADLFAQGKLEEARRAYEQAVAQKPDDPKALAGLARSELFDGHEDKAIELARKSLAIAPDGPVASQILSTAQARKSAFEPDKFRIAAPFEAPTRIKFERTDPLPVVTVTLNGGRRAHFLIDTGAPSLMVSPKLAQELGLQLQPGSEGVFAGGRRATIDRTVVPKVRLGSVEVSNVPAGVNPSGGAAPAMGSDVEGVIGSGFLLHFLSTLDYCKGELVLQPRSNSAGFERQAQAENANIVQMWLAADHFILARGRLNKGSEGVFLIDTGLGGGGVMATKETLDEAGIPVDTSNVRTGQGAAGAVQFATFQADPTMGKLSRTGITGIYTLTGNQFTPFPFVKGLLSHQFFRQSRLTFDFDAMRLVTQQCA